MFGLISSSSDHSRRIGSLPRGLRVAARFAFTVSIGVDSLFVKKNVILYLWLWIVRNTYLRFWNVPRISYESGPWSVGNARMYRKGQKSASLQSTPLSVAENGHVGANITRRWRRGMIRLRSLILPSLNYSMLLACSRLSIYVYIFACDQGIIRPDTYFNKGEERTYHVAVASCVLVLR